MQGYKVLTELQNLLNEADSTTSRVAALIADASNRFYHLIPHNFGERARIHCILLFGCEEVKKLFVIRVYGTC